MLNDFNRAEIMLFNEKDQEYCRYRNNPGHGDWRAPEEYYDKPLDEKIDIWSLGNNVSGPVVSFRLVWTIARVAQSDPPPLLL